MATVKVKLRPFAVNERNMPQKIQKRPKQVLAIVEAVKYIIRHPEAPRIIYSDSITAITDIVISKLRHHDSCGHKKRW